MSDSNTAVQERPHNSESGEGSIPIQILQVPRGLHRENCERYARAEAEHRHEDCAMILREIIQEETNPLAIKAYGKLLEDVINRLPYGRRNVIMNRRLTHERPCTPDSDSDYQQQQQKAVKRTWWWSRTNVRT